MSEATALLRPSLLEGVCLLVACSAQPVALSVAAGPLETTPVSALLPEASFADAVGAACTELGARVRMCVPEAVDETSVDRIVHAAVAEMGSVEMLVVDGAALFTHGAGDGKGVGVAGRAAEGGDAHRALRICLDTTWNITRAVVNLVFLAAESSSSSRPRPGSPTRRIVYLAPALGAGEYSGAARAGLENLSRTLSTEWARHGITVVTIAPGDGTAAGEVATLCAYLASPAGAYFSGCLLNLRGAEEI